MILGICAVYILTEILNISDIFIQKIKCTLFNSHEFSLFQHFCGNTLVNVNSALVFNQFFLANANFVD